MARKRDLYSINGCYRNLHILGSPSEAQPQPRLQPHASRRTSCQDPRQCGQRKKNLPMGGLQHQDPRRGWVQHQLTSFRCGNRSRSIGIPSRKHWASRTGRSSPDWRRPQRWRWGKRRSETNTIDKVASLALGLVRHGFLHWFRKHCVSFIKIPLLQPHGWG